MPVHNDSVALVVLAAGESKRLGTSKQLLKYENESLIFRTTRMACAAGFDKVFVVLGNDGAECAQQIKNLPAIPLYNSHPEQGLSESLKVAVREIQPLEFSAVAFLLCDQVQVTAEHLFLLKTQHSKNPNHMIATHYQGVDGVPALFPRCYFEPILNLSGDHGAQSLLRQKGVPVLSVLCEAAAIDVDTRQQANQLGIQF